MMIHISEKASLDDLQKRVIFKIQEHTMKAGVTLTVTRGHSSPIEQLRMIEARAKANQCLFSEFVHDNLHDTTLIWHMGKQIQVYFWQQTWSALLAKGFIINPPLAAVCLEHYTRPSGEDMFGQIMYPSPHIKTLDDPAPCPIDFSARIDRDMPGDHVDLDRVVEILTEAKAAGCGIRFIKPEPVNVCVHCDIEKDA